MTGSVATIPVVVISIITLFRKLDNTITTEGPHAVVATIKGVLIGIIALFTFVTINTAITAEVAGVAAEEVGTGPPEGQGLSHSITGLIVVGIIDTVTTAGQCAIVFTAVSIDAVSIVALFTGIKHAVAAFAACWSKRCTRDS